MRRSHNLRSKRFRGSFWRKLGREQKITRKLDFTGSQVQTALGSFHFFLQHGIDYANQNIQRNLEWNRTFHNLENVCNKLSSRK